MAITILRLSFIRADGKQEENERRTASTFEGSGRWCHAECHNTVENIPESDTEAISVH
jgi:hypothetical protein